MVTLGPLDPATTALVLVDLQKGITRLELEPRPAAEIVARASTLAGGFRAAGARVVLVRVSYRVDGADRLRAHAARAPAASPPPADFAEFDAGLHTEPADLLVTKHQWGAFYGTDLDLLLRRNVIGTVVLAGIATHMGVESTAREAWERAYRLILVADAMGAPAVGDHTHSVQRIFPALGVVCSAGDVRAALPD